MMKRRRADSDEGEDAKLAALLEASDEYTPYVPLKQRLKGGNGNGGARGAGREEQRLHGRERDHEPAVGDDSGDEDAEDLEAAHAHAAAEKERRKREIERQVAEAKKSLLDVQEEMRRKREQMDPTQIKLELQRQQEARIMGEASQVQTNALQSAAERAHGVQYTESMKTGWTPPAHIRAMTGEDCDVRATG